MARPSPEETRLNLLIRALGFLFIITGIIIGVLASSTPMPSPLSGTFYIVSALMVFVGIIALISRLKG